MICREIVVSWDDQRISNIQVQIGAYRDLVDLLSKIDSLPRPAGGTNIYAALSTMRNMFQAEQRFDGKSLKRFVAIIITDGVDNQPALVQSEARAAHADGIVVMPIGKTVCAKTRSSWCITSGNPFTLIINDITNSLRYWFVIILYLWTRNMLIRA